MTGLQLRLKLVVNTHLSKAKSTQISTTFQKNKATGPMKKIAELEVLDMDPSKQVNNCAGRTHWNFRSLEP